MYLSDRINKIFNRYSVGVIGVLVSAAVVVDTVQESNICASLQSAKVFGVSNLEYKPLNVFSSRPLSCRKGEDRFAKLK